MTPRPDYFRPVVWFGAAVFVAVFWVVVAIALRGVL